MNLLEETLAAMRYNGKTCRDIAHIGNIEFGCDWKTFKELADKKYDSGYGSEEVALDLKIIFDDNTWLERAEYDGSEWWEYKCPPAIPAISTKIRSVFVTDYECRLREIHEKLAKKEKAQ